MVFSSGVGSSQASLGCRRLAETLASRGFRSSELLSDLTPAGRREQGRNAGARPGHGGRLAGRRRPGVHRGAGPGPEAHALPAGGAPLRAVLRAVRGHALLSEDGEAAVAF